MNQIPLMIAGAQLGITICSLGLGAIAEPALAHLLEAPVRRGRAAGDGACTRWRSCSPWAWWCSCTRWSARWCRRTSPWPVRSGRCSGSGRRCWRSAWRTKPLLVAMKWASRQVLRIWRIEAADAVKTVFTAEELAGLVAQARTEGLLDPEEHARITGALALHEPHRGRRAAAVVDGDHGAPRTCRRRRWRCWPPAPAGPASRWCSGRPAGCWASCTSRSSPDPAPFQQGLQEILVQKSPRPRDLIAPTAIVYWKYNAKRPWPEPNNPASGNARTATREARQRASLGMCCSATATG